MRPALLALVAIGCAQPASLPPVRFANMSVVRVVDDRRDVALRPASRRFMHDVYHYDGTLQRRLARAMELPRAQRALGVNALDEVPDSTWFINRIGVRALSPAEIERGPLTSDGPDEHLPLTIESTKIGGTSVGFIARDARGARYLLKFDAPGFAEQETGAHVIVDRLLWACGYNVTEDRIVYLRPEQVVVAADAKAHDRDGTVRHLDRDEVLRTFAGLEHAPDGTVRAMASRWLDGKPLGGHPAEGVRADDPNDLIAHELRRDLRGAYTMFSWLDHVDVQEGNYLDMWVADRGDPKRHYVVHYMIDFGKSLGVMAGTGFDRRRGHTYLVDFADMAVTLASAGLLSRNWEGRSGPGLPGVALFEAETFDPATWHPDTPAYVPFLTADRFDKAWGARIVARFTRPQIEAAVAAARFSDPRAARYIVDTLIARQRAIVAHWFAEVSALDQLSLEPRSGGVAVCFTDLALTNDVARGPTSYEVSAFAWAGRVLGATATLAPGAGGRTCTAPIARAADAGGYTIVSLATHRDGAVRTLFVHLANDPGSGAPRIIGLWRD